MEILTITYTFPCFNFDDRCKVPMSRIEVSWNGRVQKEEFGKDEDIPKMIQTYTNQGYSASQDKIGDFIDKVIAAPNKGTDHKQVKCTLTLMKNKTPTT